MVGRGILLTSGRAVSGVVQHLIIFCFSKSLLKMVSPSLVTLSKFSCSLPEVFCCSAVQSLSRVQLFATPWTAAHQASLSITNSQSLLKLMSFELVMPSNYLILCHPLLLLPSIFPNIRVFSNESALGCPNAVTRGSFWFFR